MVGVGVWKVLGSSLMGTKRSRRDKSSISKEKKRISIHSKLTFKIHYLVKIFTKFIKRFRSETSLPYTLNNLDFLLLEVNVTFDLTVA